MRRKLIELSLILNLFSSKISAVQRSKLFISNNLWSSFASLIELEGERSVLILSSWNVKRRVREDQVCHHSLLTSIKIFSQGQGTFVQGIPELHPHSKLHQVGNFRKELDDGVLQCRAQELPRELVRHLQLLQALGARRGLDDVDHHVGSDRVGLQVESSDGFV